MDGENQEQMKINYHDSVNFGDALSPYLFEKITGKKAILNTEDPHVMMVGSILSEAKSNTTVWGAGLGRFDEVVPKCDLRAVRGKLSQKKAQESGMECEVLGDPALLLPRFYSPSVVKKYNFGIIPHFVDWYTAHQHFKGYKIINILADTETVIREILSCYSIASSCLHGLIAAEAYGIPTGHITFGDTLSGDGFKFQDYYSSINVEFREPTLFTEPIYCTKKKLDIDLDKLMDSCPFK